MFKGGNGKVDVSNSPDKLNRLVEGTFIKGDIKADSNFRIDGKLNGSLDTLGKLVIGPNGRVEGDVKCSNADIEGEMIGNIIVDGLLNIKATAKINGNITTNQIGMEIGCEFSGVCNYIEKNGTTLIAESAKIGEPDSEIVY
ncbi:MAG: polymer-forming cytoskeletal protein [Crocinitomix sp.]|nr:polymer-forming cytoskeletal protein [Crocinitomix sp.]